MNTVTKLAGGLLVASGMALGAGATASADTPVTHGGSAGDHSGAGLKVSANMASNTMTGTAEGVNTGTREMGYTPDYGWERRFTVPLDEVADIGVAVCRVLEGGSSKQELTVSMSILSANARYHTTRTADFLQAIDGHVTLGVKEVLAGSDGRGVPVRDAIIWADVRMAHAIIGAARFHFCPDVPREAPITGNTEKEVEAKREQELRLVQERAARR